MRHKNKPIFYSMKFLQILVVLIFFFSCKNESKPDSKETLDSISKDEITTSIYPETITKVFDAHGGIDQWNKMKTLSFSIKRDGGNEVTTTDLKSRMELITTPNYKMGYDGNNLWLKENEGFTFKSDPKFYKGLYMYFYAMPFIVGDSGIIYENTEPLKFEDKSYPGILVSYEAGVGESSDDQYIIYYDDKTGQMKWLAYTVTYFEKGKKSTNFRYIKYNNWQTINGLVLPKSIDWYNYENDQPTTKKSTVDFVDIELSEKAKEKSFFLPVDGAKLIN